MGSKPSILQQHGFTLVREEGEASLVRSQEGDQYLVRQVNKSNEDVFKVNEILKQLEHPHIIGHQSFKEDCTLYVLVDYSEGRDLYQKIEAKREPEEQFTKQEILDYFIKICMALKHLHSNKIVHRDLRAQNILFTEFGTVCLGELAEIKERAGAKSGSAGELTNIPPEILKGGLYHDKSDIWSLGCLLYQLCMMKTPFTAESAVALVPKILSGSYTPLPLNFSQPLRQLLSDALQTDPELRPSAQEILQRPFVIKFLREQSESTVDELQESLEMLRALADGLEKVHFGTTVGSLTGGVIGAAGGITSIVGLILAPFTLGTSLIVTGVGVGVAAAGGAAAGVSNITNMVNELTDRRNIKNIIRKFQEKMNSVVVSLQHICEGLEALNLSESADGASSSGAKAKMGANMGRGLGGIPELVRLLQVGNLGKVVAQTARAVRVAEMATGIFSAFFLAVDVFFIGMDAKELHHIRQKKTMKSKTMKFVQQIRETAASLEESVNELRKSITIIPKVEMKSL